MKPLGPQSAPERFAKLDGRTRLAKLAKSLRSDLTLHVGGNPSATQKMLIEQAVQLQMHIWLLDEKTAEGRDFTGHDTHQYLAWSNSLSRLLRQLGLKGVAKPAISLADHIAGRTPS